MIFYFSGTGNSKYVAERLGKLLDERTVSIASVMKDGNDDNIKDTVKDMIADDVVGIVAPVYMFGLPSIVIEFISSVKLKSKKVFTVMTYGGVPADASAMLRKELVKRGAEVTHSFEIRIPDNYVPIYRVPDEDVQEKLFKSADIAIDKIPERLKKDKDLKKRSLPGRVMSFLFYGIYGRRNTKEFKVTKKCNGCGKCEKICPVNMISMDGGKPTWEPGKCIKCLACVHRCPTAAIQIGKSKKHGRYVNPNVKFDD